MKNITIIFQKKNSKSIVDVVTSTGRALDEIVREISLRDKEAEILVDCDEDSVLVQTGDYPKNFLTPFEISSILNLNPFQLYPIITIDREGTILMNACGNQQSLDLSLSTGFAHYYSRSRKKLWKKGEESGHTQKIQKVLFSENRDCFIFVVDQNVAACHTGYYSCFFTMLTEHGSKIVYPEKKFEPEIVYSPSQS